MAASRRDIFFVLFQFILFGAYLVEIPSIQLNFPDDANFFNIILAGAGIAMIVISMLQLNKNLSPFPTPKQDGQLVITGLFHYVRHPIYSGILMTMFFLAIFYDSGYKLAITILMTVLFYYKSGFEEFELEKKFPKYRSYKAGTGRFYPKF